MPPVGKRRGVGLALDQLLAGELGDRGAVAGGAVEGVVLLGGRAGQRLEPVRVVGGALLHRPFLHRLRDRVGERRVERLAALERALQRLEHVLGQAAALHRHAEHVRGEDLVAGKGQVQRAERAPVGAPLRGCHVLLAALWHGRARFLLVKFCGLDGASEPPARPGHRIVALRACRAVAQLAKARALSFDRRPHGQTGLTRSAHARSVDRRMRRPDRGACATVKRKRL